MLQSEKKQTGWDRFRNFVERNWTSFFAAFPERQILIRTDGRVRLFVFRSWLQIAMAGIALLLAAAVFFICIGVVVQGRIIAAEHSRLREAQALYDTRLREAQARYDSDSAAIQGLEAQQNALAAIIERKQAVESALSFPAGANHTRVAPSSDSDRTSASTGLVPDSGIVQLPLTPTLSPFGGEGLVRLEAASAASPSVTVQAGLAQTSPESFVTALINRFAEFFGRKSGVADSPDPPILHPNKPQQSSLVELKTRQLALLRELDRSIQTDNARFRRTLQNVGLAPEAFIARANASASERAGGGEPLPTPPEPDADSGDREYLGELENAANSLDMLTHVIKGMNAVPLRLPIDRDYGSASGFGKRRDPFTKRIAFHSGLDLSGPRGSPVRATASGRVVYAGRKGGYGNLIEIDHGYGIRTRYGHLRSTSVRSGAFVERGTQVGSLGSTGHSTGPHVHYEVWYKNSPRDPRTFINAGQRLLQE